MKTHFRSLALAAFMIVSGAAFAQTDEHHPDADDPQAPIATPAPETIPGSLPEQCTTMMSMMQKMMPMMQGGMMQDGMMQGGMQDKPMDTASMSDASKAYMEAMKRMDGPMMEGIQAGDPDAAFVHAMIPHHQGAIDMARAVLQFGKDDQVKAWANQVITAQQAEIDAMREWLKQHAK